jgi:polysaccharide biosynthesis/export protein
VGHSVSGSSLSMVVTVRGFWDRRAAKPVLLAAAFAVCLQVASGQAPIETPQQTNDQIQHLAALAQARPAGIPIGTGDLVHIDVFDVPELSRDARVSDSGDISFPLIPGKISAAGLTIFQLEDKLAQLLIENGLVSHPQVSVFLKEQNSQPVSVVGAVNHPLIYQVIRPTTLLEVLAAAGGITDDAGPQVIISRPAHLGTPTIQPASEKTDGPPDQQTITIRLQDLLESGDSKYNVSVYGGDSVSVPRAGIVYVLGAGVAQPGGYVMQSHGDQITVLKAVALARGLTGYAKADDAVILRTNPATGQRDQIPVQIKRVEKHKADDVVMKSSDILYVPDSAGRKVLVKGAEAAIGIGSGIAIYRGQY